MGTPKPVPLDDSRIQQLLQPYVGEQALDSSQLSLIRRYLDLIVQWNARTNLTAVREPEAILQRQIGESLFCAQFLPETGSLLDFGSGAGLPGIPIAILHPGLHVTLAESQGKKASFLREAARTLALPVTIWSNRVEAMPVGQQFDTVTMRAVDDSERMLPVAGERVSQHGRLIRYIGESVPVEISGWVNTKTEPVPNSKGLLQILTRA
jgi:16S rRNA (guanine527-N7)-methyltransferase